MRQQQAFVDDRAGRQARDVEVLAAFDGRFTDGFFDPLADDVELAFELRVVQHVPRDKDLAHEGLGLPGLHADRVALDRHVTPAEQACAFLLDDLAEQRFALLPRRRTGRQKHLPYAVLAGLRQFDANITGCAPQEFVRYLEQNSGAVPRTGIATLRAAVREIFEDLQTLADDVVRLLALDVDDKADAAGIFFVSRVVEPLLRWKPWKFHVTYLVRKAGLFPAE